METSSRIFVRNLPPRFSEDEFRKVFSKYPITDIKLFENRRFGYVGYKSPEEAASAVKYFNKSFIRLSKINVEIARPVSKSGSSRDIFKLTGFLDCRPESSQVKT